MYEGILKRALAFNSILVLSACGGGGGSASPTPPSTPPPAPADTTAPVISSMAMPLPILLWVMPIPMGASATDNVDGTVNVSVTNSYTDAVGTYTINGTATDNVGNQSQLTRTVIVSAATLAVSA